MDVGLCGLIDMQPSFATKENQYDVVTTGLSNIGQNKSVVRAGFLHFFLQGLAFSCPQMDLSSSPS